MRTKVNVFLTAVIVAASFAGVQKSYGQITLGGKEGVLGIRAGVNFSTISGDMEDAKMKPGIQLGVVANFPMKNKKLTFQPGLIFAQQGAKWKDSETERKLGISYEMDTEMKMVLNYLQLPVNLLYRHELNSGNILLLQAGPYLGYGISGKSKFKETANFSGLSKQELELLQSYGISTNISESSEENINFGSDKKKHDFKSFDLGLGIGAGLLFNEKFQVGLGYNLGLADIGHYFVVKNNCVSLTLTLMLGQ